MADSLIWRLFAASPSPGQPARLMAEFPTKRACTTEAIARAKKVPNNITRDKNTRDYYIVPA